MSNPYFSLDICIEILRNNTTRCDVSVIFFCIINYQYIVFFFDRKEDLLELTDT